MFQERKKIAVKDLKIGDLVVGTHEDYASMKRTIVAGQITAITTKKKSDDITYHVKGDTLIFQFGDPIKLSGILEENEVEVIDPQTCSTIIELYNLANKQISNGISPIETAEKVSDIRHKSRKELEEKYAVG